VILRPGGHTPGMADDLDQPDADDDAAAPAEGGAVTGSAPQPAEEPDGAVSADQVTDVSAVVTPPQD
jgi:hypothetical protein